MSTFRRYGGLNYSATNNIIKSYISNSEQMNINNYSGQANSKEMFASHIDLTGNSILHTGTIYFQDGTSMSTAGAVGATGSPGVTGDKGPQGDPGPTGSPGVTGDKGIQGDPGVTGDKGPQGDPGPTGSPGVTGDKGIQGDPGVTGDKGPQGDPGPTGSPGVTGDKGPTGNQGATGNQGPPGPAGATGYWLANTSYAGNTGIYYDNDITIIPTPVSSFLTITSTNTRNIPLQQLSSDRRYICYEFTENDIYTITFNTNMAINYVGCGPGGTGGNAFFQDNSGSYNCAGGGGGGSGAFIVSPSTNVTNSTVYTVNINASSTIINGSIVLGAGSPGTDGTNSSAGLGGAGGIAVGGGTNGYNGLNGDYKTSQQPNIFNAFLGGNGGHYPPSSVTFGGSTVLYLSGGTNTAVITPGSANVYPTGGVNGGGAAGGCVVETTNLFDTISPLNPSRGYFLLYFSSGNNRYFNVNSQYCSVYTTGTMTATSYNALSDKRIKTDIMQLDDTYYTIDKLNPVIYKNILTNNTDFGFIAQELEEIFPFLVTKCNDTEYYSINYNGLIALLVKEVKLLKNKISDIEIYGNY